MVHSNRRTTKNGALPGVFPSQGGRIPIAQASQKNRMDGKKASGSSFFFTKRNAMLFFVLAFIFLKHQEDFRRQDVNAPLQLHDSVGRKLASTEIYFRKRGKKEKVTEVKKESSGSGNKAPSVAGNKAPRVGRNKAPTEVENKSPTEGENKAPTEVENKSPTEGENKTPTEPENKTPFKDLSRETEKRECAKVKWGASKYGKGGSRAEEHRRRLKQWLQETGIDPGEYLTGREPPKSTKQKVQEKKETTEKGGSQKPSEQKIQEKKDSSRKATKKTTGQQVMNKKD
ncbi:Uncharacterized protein PCOAH_00002320 [Plasmodium coatneyi]|uniref:Uncharacterized protein n=1 Tax=Plasmodium coatneyi TaxID=208452 RepID=A0A1B1DTZ3_9APIC|nr:Uncharacterized protein PCOAH_00002320 [Plasmodium coatneyi]ANQ06055.1 Uncharacterized protein PCOAH_00002320 [Plasmodium coatneyi]